MKNEKLSEAMELLNKASKIMVSEWEKSLEALRMNNTVKNRETVAVMESISGDISSAVGTLKDLIEE